MTQYLIINDRLAATVTANPNNLKQVDASYEAIDDALNMEFPRVLLNARSAKISGNKKWEKDWRPETPTAEPLPGGRNGCFIINRT